MIGHNVDSLRPNWTSSSMSSSSTVDVLNFGFPWVEAMHGEFAGPLFLEQIFPSTQAAAVDA